MSVADLFSREHRDINLLLTQGWRQAHNAFQPIGTHDAVLLIAEIVAWEERGWRHVLIEDQHVRREDAGLFIDFTGQCQGQLADIRRHAESRDRTADTRHVQ